MTPPPDTDVESFVGSDVAKIVPVIPEVVVDRPAGRSGPVMLIPPAIVKNKLQLNEFQTLRLVTAINNSSSCTNTNSNIIISNSSSNNNNNSSNNNIITLFI